MEDYNIEQDLSIDRYKLDLEAMSLPSLYFRYSDLVREAKEIVSEKKDHLEAVIAERSISIREECATNGTKTTEGIITSLVNSDKAVLEAKKELRDAMATHGRLQVALSALDTKKAEIDNLVKLYCNSYYANKEVQHAGYASQEYSSTSVSGRTKPFPHNS